MLSHVLVPLDGSELAQSALDHALDVISAGSTITLLTVLEPQEVALYDFYPSTIIPKSNEDEKSTYAAIARAQSYLKRLAQEIAQVSRKHQRKPDRPEQHRALFQREWA